ncbi:MAG: peptidoglycan-associated lipoprotein Pal [Candidatus Omnitrophica bacterium]|nr:peptidoglycan-associated lipoprotein Pal [Candidatus Omnitrophota bacterium]MCM8806430.1 peptidoglycan-associated lipoprotein Pal [Candidatus Omnitrophota bacterium]
MRKFLLIFLIPILILSGCKCPVIKKKVEEEMIKPEEKKELTKPEEKREIEGKATPEEIKKAIRGEEIPVAEIPKGKRFVKPEEISLELAKIFQNIYFDFDKYDIRPDAEEVLKKIGDYLLKNPDIKILIEGHCDERGTREYNLVLGEQRALSARRYLIIMGVSPKRMYTLSYGEDMPADPRSNEEAWAKNRRCEFKIEVEK